MTTMGSEAAEGLRVLADAYWEGVLERNPVLATQLGDFRYDDRLPDVGPAGRAEEEAALRETLARLQAIPTEGLGTDDRITWDMLRLAAEFGLDGLRLRLDEMAVDQMFGPQVWLQELVNWQPCETPEQAEKLVARYRAFPTYMDQYLEALRDGARDGRTSPRIAVERVAGQLRSLLETAPAESPLTEPTRRPSTGDGAGKRLTAEDAGRLVRVVEERVYPAFEQMREYFTEEYLERHARQDPGVWAVRDGAEIYATVARQHTTTTLTPEELHQIGLEDLAGIHVEMRAIMATHGDASGNVRAFTERLTRDPANLPTSREEIVRTSERLLGEAQAALPRMFGRLPRTGCEVKAIEAYREADAPAAFYYPPSADLTRQAVFYVNTHEPSARPRHNLAALAFHEGVPGHHLQIALAQEAQELPAFRRLSAGSLANAYVEGWALYTERLADEMGLYPDDLARFGMLGYQAWRACRLVVDTGLHAMRWTRQQAIEFFYENVGLSERETVNEVDRYIIWPGQALSYKVGQREIERLRRELERESSERFDVRGFHDEVLRYGPLPLVTLEQVLRAWGARVRD